MFVLGFIQGTIRRLLGLASMLFSFLFAANLRDSLGTFLAANWNQFSDEYAVMIGFESFFVIATIPQDPNELILLRGFWEFLDPSGTAALFRNTLIPAFITLFGLFVPNNLKQ